MKPVFEYTKGMRETELHYCPGCTHGIAHRLIMEVLEERGEKFCTFFINNAIYGMTGGQMAPTTLIGQKATTCVEGRTVEQAGMPMRMCELISCQDRAVYVERVSLDSPANVRKAKSAIRRAFKVQDLKLGFAFVEFLSICPTNWGMSPLKAKQWLMDNMVPYYPLGVIKETSAEVK